MKIFRFALLLLASIPSFGQQLINTTPGQADTAPQGAAKINANFQSLWPLLSAPANNPQPPGSVLCTPSTNTGAQAAVGCSQIPATALPTEPPGTVLSIPWGGSAASPSALPDNVVRANVSCDGSTDVGPALNTLLGTLSTTTATVIQLPAGICYINTSVAITTAVTIQGQGYTEGPSPNFGTWIKINSTGFTPFAVSGVNGRGTMFKNLAVIETQPTSAGGWTPTAYNYVFDIENTLGEVTFDHVLLAGVTNGIKSFNSGRTNIISLFGQVYTNGIFIDNAQDIPRIEYVHFWTYVTSDANFVAYQQANLDAILLGRVDGIYLGDIFSLADRSAIHMTQTASGITTKAYLNNLYADFSQYGIWIDSNNSTIQIANATTQHQDFNNTANAQAGSFGLYINASNVVAQIGNWRTDQAYSNAVNIAGNSNQVDFGSFYAKIWNTQSDGSPAIYTGATTGNIINIATTPILSGGNGGALTNLNGSSSVAQALSTNLPGGTVNLPFFYGSVTGSGISTLPVGTDTNIDYIIGAKGNSGSVRLQSGANTVFRVDNPSGGNTDMLVQSGTGAYSFIEESGATNANMSFNSKGSGYINMFSGAVEYFRVDANAGLVTLGGAPGADGLRVSNVASAINGVKIIPQTAGNYPIIGSSSNGSDTNVDLEVASFGSASSVRIFGGSSAVARFAPNGGTSDLLVRDDATQLAMVVEGIGNANLTLKALGTGYLSLNSGAVSASTAVTVSGCGTAASINGGVNAGSFLVGTGASPCTFVLTFSATAPHGWACAANDQTSAVSLPQSAQSTTTCSVKGNAATSDLIVFQAMGY